MHRKMSLEYGNSVCHSCVCEWMEKFENGRTSIKCEEGARPAIEGSSAFMACPQCKTFYFGGIKKSV